MIPFQPIIAAGETPFAMLQDLWIHHPDRVFPPIHYSSVDALIASLDETISSPPRRDLSNSYGGRARPWEESMSRTYLSQKRQV
jgi:hypothetical protein